MSSALLLENQPKLTHVIPLKTSCRIACARENFVRWRRNWRPSVQQQQRQMLGDYEDALAINAPARRVHHSTGFEISRRVLPPTSMGRGTGQGMGMMGKTTAYFPQSISHYCGYNLLAQNLFFLAVLGDKSRSTVSALTQTPTLLNCFGHRQTCFAQTIRVTGRVGVHIIQPGLWLWAHPCTIIVVQP